MEYNQSVIDRRNTPFVMVTKAVIEDDRLKAADKSVYMALCLYADNKTSECWPSRESLMKKAGVSDRTLRNSLQTLEETGYIKIEPRFSEDGRRLSNLYILLDVPSVNLPKGTR